ncbi:MAG: transposase, partial [Desulfovibrio sp.]|nr:transposase [Desulfovibrio sp.]
GLLREWKKEVSTSFLAEAHSQILQQTLKDLDRAYKNFFEKRAAFPRFKKKGIHDSFRYPQGFKVDEQNNRIFLPKIGWMKYRNSRTILGIPKQITVSLTAGKWYVSIQTEREIVEPIHPSSSAVGIDMGIARFVTISDGTYIEPLNIFRNHEEKLAKIQRKRSRMEKLSKNWQKQTLKLQKQHRKIANVRKDFLHKHTTTISKNHAMVVMEDLQVRNMSRSASGTLEQPGRNVSAKRGLNKAILDQGWFEFRWQLTYKQAWRGGILLVIPPQYTSQTCSTCGCVDKSNRQSQSVFKCTSCGFEANADETMRR